MAKHIKRSVIPIYLIGVVWLVFALFFSLRTLADYALCAVVSGAVFVVGKAVFPDRVYQLPGEQPEEPEKKAEQPRQKEKKQETTGDPELDKLIQERDRALSEMRRLNDSIEDETISAQIDHLEEVTRKIIGEVVKQPKKLPQIRRFLNYFLPTTLKILNAYDRMDAAGIAGDNISTTKAKVENMMGTIVQAFDKQLDSLFGAEAMDISTDITVMENLLAQEGLSGKDKTASPDGGTTLEL
ncbi:MAG: 5-bromo-4-chloroindolyl phosphate hydrolysis family protein [Oscillospiraceae bacterium]|nr:5-bromo-4-chloroindolyl phosphate hydrolysis family protein [Oscillospiraceae bacterium]